MVCILITGCAAPAKRPAYKKFRPKTPPAKIERERAPETGAPKEIIRTTPTPPPATSPSMRASARLVEDGRRKLADGDFENAEHTFQEAINIDPNNGIAYYYLAKARYELAKYDTALGVLDKAEGLLTGSKEWVEAIGELRKLIHSLLGFGH